MIKGAQDWIARQIELRAELDLVRTRLPKHVTEPDPDIYRSDNYVTLDFETTIIGKGLALYPDNRIVLAAWELGPGHPSRPHSGGGATHRMLYKWGGEYTLTDLVRDIEAADFLVCHNAKFELGWLSRCGLDLTNVVVWCTQLGEYVIGGNRWTWKQLALDVSARRRIGEGKDTIVSRMIKGGICCTQIPRSWLLSYCLQDVRVTRKLFVAQRNYMLSDGQLLPVMYTRCLATPVLADLENNGMQLDEEMVTDRCDTLEIEYAKIEQQLEAVTGGINVNSKDQVAYFLYGEIPDKHRDGGELEAQYEGRASLGFAEVRDRKGNPVRTGGGAASTSQGTIERLRASTSAQREFLQLYTRSRELHAELTKYLRKFRDCCGEADGRLRAVFNQSSTRTHRLSSTGLDYGTQFQNFPRAYKPMFRARRQGWLVGEADGAQLEFRVAAHLGRDPIALDDIIAGTDIHSVTAGIIGCSRQDAKPHTFKPLYGGRSGTPSEVRYYEFFREKYGSITDTQRRWIDAVLDTKQLRTEWGLVYYWPTTRLERSGYVVNSTSICNYPVQAFATAEIIPTGLVYFWHYVKAMELQMLLVNTVHDSVITELPPEEVDLFHVISARCLIDEVYSYIKRVYGIDLVVPLGAGVMTGVHWADKAAKDGETTYTATEEMYG